MTISELRDYLAKYIGDGKGDTLVCVCYRRDNVITDSSAVMDAVYLEWKDGDRRLALLMD